MKRVIILLLVCQLSNSTLCMQENKKWDGDHYHNNSTPQFNTAQELLSTLELHGNEVVLDVGCGSGKTTASIALRVPHGTVYGVDPSESMIDAAQKNFKDVHNLCFRQSSAENFNIDEVKRFDVVTAFSCLHWIKNQQEVMDKIAQRLKPGGAFLAVMAYRGTRIHSPVIQILIETGLSDKWKNFMPQEFINDTTRNEFLKNQYYPHNEESFTALLKTVGLQPVEVKKTTRTVAFASRKELVDWISGWIGGLQFLGSIPSERRTEFVDDAINASFSDNQSIKYVSERLLIHAKK